jgi:hypothetical protein
LKSEDGRSALWRLIEGADVLVEGFRPGVIERLGFGYEACAERNPRLVYCSISAFGQSGPLSDHPAHDMGAQALAGFCRSTTAPTGRRWFGRARRGHGRRADGVRRRADGALRPRAIRALATISTCPCSTACCRGARTSRARRR